MSRASSASWGSSRSAASSSSGGASLPRLRINAISARNRSSRARWSSSSGVSSAAASSASAASGLPASSLASAAASARSPRRTGSGVRSAARARNAAPRPRRPPRPCARPAELLQLARDSLVEPGRPVRAMPCAPGGILLGVDRLSERAVDLLARGAGRCSVDRGPDERMAESHSRSELDQSFGLCRADRIGAIPSRSAARQRRVTSPIGSAAAVSSSRRESGGSDSKRRRKLRSIRPDSGSPSGSPNPPASSAGVRPWGSSSSASGLPRVSATMRSRTRSSSLPRIAESSRARASRVGEPGRRPVPEVPPTRVRARSARGPRRPARRAPRAGGAQRTPAPAPTRDRATVRLRPAQTSGRSSAASASRPSTARPTKKRSGRRRRTQPERGAERIVLRAGQALERGRAWARTAGADRRTRAPSRTRRRRPARCGNPTRARRRTPAAPSCRSLPRRAETNTRL